jgi:putative transposase
MQPQEQLKRPREGEASAEPQAESMQQPQLPVRKRPAHGVELREGPATVVFVTVCTEKRKPWLANAQVHELLQKIWREATAWLVGKYMIMPDHLHLFAGLNNDRIPLDNWVKYWKSQFTKRHQQPEYRWQADHWDTRMRTQEQYVEKMDYVMLNPERKGLVARSEDWPYQGEIYDLPW